MPSGWLPNVVPNQPILSSWGNTIRDRSVTVFDNAAQRDAQLTAPTEGMVCYLLDTNSLLVYQGAAAGWTRPWNTAWGIEGRQVVSTTNQAANNTTVDLTGMAITWTPIAGRQYSLEVEGQPFLPTAMGNLQLHITDAANAIVISAIAGGANAPVGTKWPIAARTPAMTFPAASITHKIRFQSTSSNGQTGAAAATPVIFTIRDVGPAGPPAATLLPAPEPPAPEAQPLPEQPPAPEQLPTT